MDENQIEDLIVVAETAIDDVVAAVEEAADADVEVSGDLLARARGLRKFRAKRDVKRADGDQAPGDKKDDEAEIRSKGGRSQDEEEIAALEEQLRKARAKRSARTEVEEADAQPLTDEEEKENASIERSAKRFGLDGFVKGLREFEAKPSFIKRALQKEMAKVGARGIDNTDVRPAAQVASVASAERTRSRYDKLNNRG